MTWLFPLVSMALSMSWVTICLPEFHHRGNLRPQIYVNAFLGLYGHTTDYCKVILTKHKVYSNFSLPSRTGTLARFSDRRPWFWRLEHNGGREHGRELQRHSENIILGIILCWTNRLMTFRLVMSQRNRIIKKVIQYCLKYAPEYSRRIMLVMLPHNITPWL